jgi:hypothetical protein
MPRQSTPIPLLPQQVQCNPLLSLVIYSLTDTPPSYWYEMNQLALEGESKPVSMMAAVAAVQWTFLCTHTHVGITHVEIRFTHVMCKVCGEV